MSKVGFLGCFHLIRCLKYVDMQCVYILYCHFVTQTSGGCMQILFIQGCSLTIYKYTNAIVYLYMVGWQLRINNNFVQPPVACALSLRV